MASWIPSWSATSVSMSSGEHEHNQFGVSEARMRATGTSNTVTKGDGNSRPVGSKRRDSRRETENMSKKTKKKVIATFRIPEVYKIARTQGVDKTFLLLTR